MACDPVDEVVELAASLPPPPWAGRGIVPGIACRVLSWSGRWDLAREATARGWESARSSGLVHVASYGESALAEIDRAAGRLTESEAEARTASDIVRDLAPVSLPAWSAIANLLATLIAAGSVQEATELAEPWDLSAPFSVCRCRRCRWRSGHAAPRAWRDRGRGGGPAERRRGSRGDAPAQPGGGSLAPGGRAGARRARTHGRGPVDRRRGRETSSARSAPRT